MKKIIISALILSMVGVGTANAQQIPLFNSYILNQFLINPSYAGNNGKTNIYGINRVQYAGFDGAPVTFMLTADGGFKDKKFGLGGALYSDRNNLLAQNGFQLAYAYNIKLNETWNIGMGLNAGMVQWTLNFDRLKVDDPSENVLSNFNSSASTFRTDIGFRLSSEKIEVGVSIPQAVSSKVKYSDYLKNADGKYTSIPHFIANLSYLHTLNDNIKIKPSVLIRGSKGIKPQIDIIGLVDWKSKAYATLGYRTNYALSIGGGVRLGRGITFGYAYDKPVNNISKFSMGSHEIIVGITLGERAEEKPEPSNNLSKEAETKLKADMEKQIQEKLSAEFDNKLKQELDLKVNKAVEVQVAKALEKLPVSTTPSDGKTSPGTSAAISKDDLEKIKKDIEEKIRKQMDENYTKLIDEKIKKAIESKPAATPTSPASASVSKEEVEKIRKDIEEKLKIELTDKINKAVEEKMQKEIQKAKDEALKSPPEYKMTAKDKSALDSLKMKNMAYEKRIADLEKQIKNFPESDRVENEQKKEIGRIAYLNDLELKKFKAEMKTAYEGSVDPRTKKTDKATPNDESEPDKFVLVLAAFKTIKEAQLYQKLAAQTFEFPNCKIIKPVQLDGWYFVYQKSYDKKKSAWDAFGKVLEKPGETPKYPWIYVLE